MNKTYLVHSGIKGQRWGIRRYQNEDGSLTNEGRLRYGTVENMNRTRSRNKKIAIGLGVTAAAVGTTVIVAKNRKMKKELGSYKRKEAQTLANLAKGRATRKANIAKRAADVAAGIAQPTKKVKIACGSDVVIKATKNGKSRTTNLINVLGGVVKVTSKGGK